MSFDDKDEFLYHLDPAPVISGCFRAEYMAGIQQELLNQLVQIVSSVQQHSVRFSQSLPDVLRHAGSEYFLNLTALDALTQLVQGADGQFLVDTHDAPGVKPGMRAQRGYSRRSLTPQPF